MYETNLFRVVKTLNMGWNFKQVEKHWYLYRRGWNDDTEYHCLIFFCLHRFFDLLQRTQYNSIKLYPHDDDNVTRSGEIRREDSLEKLRTKRHTCIVGTEAHWFVIMFVEDVFVSHYTCGACVRILSRHKRSSVREGNSEVGEGRDVLRGCLIAFRGREGTRHKSSIVQKEINPDKTTVKRTCFYMRVCFYARTRLIYETTSDTRNEGKHN